jgi:hypothetical protein
MNKQIIADMMVLRSAIDRVRELHLRCDDCCDSCHTCCESYPCETIEALNGEQ